jgi:hypothetical protein
MSDTGVTAAEAEPQQRVRGSLGAPPNEERTGGANSARVVRALPASLSVPVTGKIDYCRNKRAAGQRDVSCGGHSLALNGTRAGGSVSLATSVMGVVNLPTGPLEPCQGHAHSYGRHGYADPASDAAPIAPRYCSDAADHESYNNPDRDAHEQRHDDVQRHLVGLASGHRQSMPRFGISVQVSGPRERQNN